MNNSRKNCSCLGGGDFIFNGDLLSLQNIGPLTNILE